jgi:hypothetical protein
MRRYAVILSALHALTGIAWFSYKHVTALLTAPDAICWPVFPACEGVRARLTEGGVRAAVIAYAALGLAGAGLFSLGLAGAGLFSARKRRAGLAVFVLATALGSAIYALDYRMRFNQTYMFGWVALAFLAAPKKRQVIQALVALFYVWAGTLKLNREWVSGAALYAKPLLVPEGLIPAACVYVLLLEMVLVWGLFSPSPRVRWSVYAQLLLFHFVSLGVVGWFYPLLMLGLTAIFPLTWLGAPDLALTFARLRSDPAARAPVAAAAALFSAFQIVPWLYPGDTALTGEGRIFALHMFDAKTECAGGATLRSSAGMSSRVSLVSSGGDVRTRCDPIAIAATLGRLCRSIEGRPDRVRVDVAIDAKRSSDGEMQPLVRAEDACRRPIAYSPWRHNEWIR